MVDALGAADGEDAGETAEQEGERHLKRLERIVGDRVAGVGQVEAGEAGEHGEQERDGDSEAGIEERRDEHSGGRDGEDVAEIEAVVVRKGEREEDLGGGDPEEDEEPDHHEPGDRVHLSRLEEVEIEREHRGAEDADDHGGGDRVPFDLVIEKTGLRYAVAAQRRRRPVPSRR